MNFIYHGSVTKEVEIKNKEDFYPTVAKLIVDEESGKRLVVTAETADGSVSYRVGVRSGTQTIFEESNSMPDSYLSDLHPAYLTCVEPDVAKYLQGLKKSGKDVTPAEFYSEISSRCKNSYKQYKLIPEGNKVTAYYGRMAVGAGRIFGERSVEYPLSSFWTKYFEKIGKGYVDRTRLYMPEVFGKTSPDVGSKGEEIPERKQAPREKASFADRLFDKLKQFAKKAVRDAQVKVPVTPEIIQAAKADLDEMRNAAGNKDAAGFNLALLDIISILQRPVATGDGTGVKRLLAADSGDFARIISRESDLLQAMEGSVMGNRPSDKNGAFEEIGIEVYKANQKQQKQVLKHLSPDLHGKVKNIYRVIPKAQKKRFDAYLKEREISNVRLLWHGSRNENWLSIIRNSLVLNPDAIITGKMFGQGIYFAPSSSKSWNYTSFIGTSWANGTSNTAFMGLYAVAYGKPYDVDTWDPYIDYRTETRNGFDCLHAHAGASLRNDEIVFYDEAAVLLDYVVEFGV